MKIIEKSNKTKTAKKKTCITLIRTCMIYIIKKRNVAKIDKEKKKQIMD